MTVGITNIGQSSTLAYQLNKTGAYVPITLLETITPPDHVVGNIVKTKLGSTFVEKRLTIPDLGECGFGVQFDYEDTTHAAMKTLLYSFPQLLTSWKITLPEGTTVTFDGWLSEFKEDELVCEDKLMADGTIILTSVPAYVPGVGG